MNRWTKIVECIKEYDDIVILTHTNMDGDAMGSSSALCHALRSLGKKCVVLLEDKVPGYLNILHHHQGDEIDLPYFVDSMPYTASLAIAVDCGEEGRIEKRLDVFKAAKNRICIDHHVQKDGFADLNVIEPDCAATGLLIYELILELGVKIDKHIAEDLYVAIVTDTGRFKFDNTTSKVHRVVADLLDYGVEGSKFCSALYDSYPLEQLKAEAYALDNMTLFSEGKAVISNITIDAREKIGAEYDQIDTCIDKIRVIQGVEIAAFLKEKEPNVYKLSLRSKNYADVNKVANSLGGGGHVRASGATLCMDLESAKKLVINAVEEELRRF